MLPMPPPVVNGGGGGGGPLDKQLERVLASAGQQRLAPILAAQDITTVALLRAMAPADFGAMGISIGSRIRLELALEGKSSTSTKPHEAMPATTQASRQPTGLDATKPTKPAPSLLWRPDPTVAPMVAPLDAATQMTLLALPPRPTRDSHRYGRRVRGHDELHELLKQGTSSGGQMRGRWKSCRHTTFHMHILDGLGAVGSRCIAALLQSAALGLNDTRCASLGSGASVTTLYQLRPQATPTQPLSPAPRGASAAATTTAGRAMPPAYCHRGVAFADNIKSIETGARIDERKETRELRLGSQQWWSTMTCWPIPMWGCTPTTRPHPPSP